MTEQQAHTLLIYMALFAVALLIVAIAVAAVAVATVRLIKHVTALTDEARTKLYPLIATVHSLAEKGDAIAKTTQGIVADVEPKIQRITTNIADTSDVYRAKVAQVDALITDTTVKARKQSDRVDGMVSDVLTKTHDVAGKLERAVSTPVRQISGIFSGAKAGIETLIHEYGATKSAPRRTPKPVAFEGENIYTGQADDYHA